MSVVRPYALGGNTTIAELTVRTGADIDSETLVVNDATDKVGIGLADPKTKLTVDGTITLKEQANADSDTAAYGQVWVKTATPNELYFTTDAGDDIQLTTGTDPAGGGASALNDLSDVSYGSGDLIITSLDKLTTSASAHDAAGVGVVLQGGSTTAGITNNIAGGALTLQGGQGKGTGAGGDIIFQVANAGGAGSSLNSYATAMTISDDGSTTFNNNNLYIGKSLWHDGDTDTRLHFFNTGDTIALEAGGVDFIRMIENGASSECVINYGGNANVDLRAAGDTETHLLFVDAGNERVSIGDSTDAPAATLEITNHASAGATGVPLLQLNSNDVDQVCVDINAANTTADVIDLTANSLTTGSFMKLVSDSSSTGDRTLIDITNDNTAAVNTILMSMKNDAIAGKGSVIIESTAAETNPLVELINSHNSADKPPMLRFNKLGHVSDYMDIGSISFFGDNSAAEPIEYCKILVEASDTTDADEAGTMHFYCYGGGTGGTASSIHAMKFGVENSGVVPFIAAYVNPAQGDCDFRVDGNSFANLLRCDAANASIGVGASPNEASAILEVESTTKGFLPPRMTTTQQNAISSPASGLMIYNTTTNKLMVYNGSAWTALH